MPAESANGMAATAPALGCLPAGSALIVPDVGEVFVRSTGNRGDSPTVVLLHGWSSTADITWHRSFQALAEHFEIIAPDLRGHGGGPRGGPDTGMNGVVHDAAALIEHLSVPPVVVVGYSYGGTVALSLAKERPDLVAGLVLCASDCCLATTWLSRFAFGAMGYAASIARLLPNQIATWTAGTVMRLMYGDDDFQRWVRRNIRGHQWSEVLAAAAALGHFDASAWIAALTVPSAVVVTADDEFISAERQLRLAERLRADVWVVGGGHGACLADTGDFAQALVEACSSVVESRFEERSAS